MHMRGEQSVWLSMVAVVGSGLLFACSSSVSDGTGGQAGSATGGDGTGATGGNGTGGTAASGAGGATMSMTMTVTSTVTGTDTSTDTSTDTGTDSSTTTFTGSSTDTSTYTLTNTSSCAFGVDPNPPPLPPGYPACEFGTCDNPTGTLVQGDILYEPSCTPSNNGACCNKGPNTSFMLDCDKSDVYLNDQNQCCILEGTLQFNGCQ